MYEDEIQIKQSSKSLIELYIYRNIEISTSQTENKIKAIKRLFYQTGGTIVSYFKRPLLCKNSTAYGSPEKKK